jgi:hypothetical protein
MLKNLTNVTVAILGAVTTSAVILPSQSMAKSLDNLANNFFEWQQANPKLANVLEEREKTKGTGKTTNPLMTKDSTQETETKEVVPEKPKVTRLVCKGCNHNESRTLDFLQDRGVTDKNALATIMGNIRQESTFTPNICEGGARVPYHACRSGGFGIIQWTNAPRYKGLGYHAARIGANPSSLDTQLDYMLYEGDWKMIEPHMKTPGKSINDYMRLARKWIRWGDHGARTDYAYNYANRLVLVEVSS